MKEEEEIISSEDEMHKTYLSDTLKIKQLKSN
jgi:hypothetical protein